jgi:hypothetical protein
MSLDSFVKITAVPELFERLQADAEQFRGDLERLQRFVELTMAERQVAAAPDLKPAAPEPCATAPVEMESIARQRLEDDAVAAAKKMVASFDLMKHQKQTTGTSLAYAMRVMREASAGFECPQTMQAIIKALDEIGTATREVQNNG